MSGIKRREPLPDLVNIVSVGSAVRGTCLCGWTALEAERSQLRRGIRAHKATCKALKGVKAA